MLLRSSITSTKKFFQKTLKNFKSLFSSDYQRLPKSTTPDPHNHLSYNSVAATTTTNNEMDNMNNNKNNTSYQELEKLYITDQWESENQKARRSRRIKKKEAALISSSPTKQQQQHDQVYSESPFHEVEKREEFYNKNNKRSLTLQRVRGKKQKDKDSLCMVEQKLRELEMLDMSNVDHVMDIEEVLHYYSRLTCPAYLEIVDRFFMEMYSELFWPAATPCSVNSRMKLRYQ